MTAFYLTTHKAGWLSHPAARFPMMVSHRTLAPYKTLPESTDPWILDSGGFSELSMFGEWRTSPAEYVRATARYQHQIGKLVWAAPQDWMCEPAMINGGMAGAVKCVGTGLSVAEHQARTVANFLELCELWPEYSDAVCPYIPVVQGDTMKQYIQNVGLYVNAGVRFVDQQCVGIGSVCRLQATGQMHDLMRAMRLAPRIHAFGAKVTGLSSAGYLITSADSGAWSYHARRSDPFPGHRHAHCNNCLLYAAAWRRRLLASLAEGDGGREAAAVRWAAL